MQNPDSGGALAKQKKEDQKGVQSHPQKQCIPGQPGQVKPYLRKEKNKNLVFFFIHQNSLEF